MKQQRTLVSLIALFCLLAVAPSVEALEEDHDPFSHPGISWLEQIFDQILEAAQNLLSAGPEEDMPTAREAADHLGIVDEELGGHIEPSGKELGGNTEPFGDELGGHTVPIGQELGGHIEPYG